MTLALVTGAASGLGRGLVARLVERGDDVIAVDIHPAVRDLGVPSFVCDVADASAIDHVRAEVGAVDLLFNNAGIAGRDSARIAAVNLGGVINGTLAFLPAMRERGSGRVVNTASLLGVRPSPSRAAYSASKAGVIAYSLALRDHLAGTGVGVSIVLPHVRSSIEYDDPDSVEAAYIAMGADPLAAAADVLAGVDAGKLWIAAGVDEAAILEHVAHLPQ